MAKRVSDRQTDGWIPVCTGMTERGPPTERGPDGRREIGNLKERGHSCPLPLVPSEKMEIRKKERERRARYPNAAAATTAATTGGQECPPSVTSSTPIAIECGARHWRWRARGGYLPDSASCRAITPSARPCAASDRRLVTATRPGTDEPSQTMTAHHSRLCHSCSFCHSHSFCHSRESGNPSSHGKAGI